MKVKNALIKLFVLLVWAVLLTLSVYWFGAFKNDELALKLFGKFTVALDYIVFAMQLLAGGFAYDVFKKILFSNLDWRQVGSLFQDTIYSFLVTLAFLIAGLSVKQNSWIFLILFFIAVYKTAGFLTEAIRKTKEQL